MRRDGGGLPINISFLACILGISHMNYAFLSLKEWSGKIGPAKWHPKDNQNIQNYKDIKAQGFATF